MEVIQCCFEPKMAPLRHNILAHIYSQILSHCDDTDGHTILHSPEYFMDPHPPNCLHQFDRRSGPHDCRNRQLLDIL